MLYLTLHGEISIFLALIYILLSSVYHACKGRPTGTATDPTHSHSEVKALHQRQHNEAWLELEQCKQSVCVQAHIVSVTFSDIHHFESAQCDVQKKSLCDIAALLY